MRLVLELREQLTTYATRKHKDAGGVDEQRVEKMDIELAGKKHRAAELLETVDKVRKELDNAKTERDRLMLQLAGLIQGTDAKTVAVIAQQLDRAEAEVELRRRALRALLSGPLPLQLVRGALYDSLFKSLHREQCFEDWEQNKARMQPNWEKFQSIFFDSAWIKGICHLPGARKSLEQTLEEAWDGLHHPRPENCDGPIWHDYLQTNERRKLEDMRARSQTSSSALRNALSGYEHARKACAQVKNELIRLQGLNDGDKSAHIEMLKSQLDDAQKRADEAIKTLSTKENEQKALAAEIQTLNATFERERKKLIDGHPERQAAREAEKVVSMIDELLPRLLALKLEALSAAVTRIFRSIHHKYQVAKITIDSDGRATLYSHDGALIDLPRSSGESQLFVLSLVGALAEVTGYRVPLIVDTPLARLSENHCGRLLDYWMSDPMRQVILLVQDKEIGADDLEPLNGSVSKTYLLRHDQIQKGVGKTWAEENAYFGTAA